jgi:hypothetical protein
MICDNLSAGNPKDGCTQFLKPEVNLLVTAINLLNVVNNAFTFS